MKQFFKPLSVIAVLAIAGPALAQETGDATTTPNEEAPDPMALSEGTVEVKTGDVYVKEQFTDWEMRCVKAQEGQPDPCQLYQLLDDGQGNSIAEINLFSVGGEGQPYAGATIVTPLETLLTSQLGLSVDGAAARKYPFSWCSQIGCFSRIGLREAEIDQFRKGGAANIAIVPVVAPDQVINLKVSLSGFTAAFKAVQDYNAAAAASQ